MKLKQPEIIQILRRRAEMNQGTFGARAFNTSFESGRTKIKNIELGRQIPTKEDLIKMSKVLHVHVDELKPAEEEKNRQKNKDQDGLYVLPQVIDMFPGLGPYLEMLNKAAVLNDRELIEYISEKISVIFDIKSSEQAVSV